VGDDERIGMVLVHLGRGVDAKLRKELAAEGLTPRHGFTLQHLCDHGPTSQQELIDVLEVDPSVLVAILNDLEKAGLAERKRDPEDRRRHIVVMSERGLEALGNMKNVLDVLENHLLTDLSPADAVQLRELLSKLRPINGSTVCAGDD
jgi:DNA-binding MarR family transcriptional regulator